MTTAAADPHNLKWYEQMAETVAQEVKLKFGVELNEVEKLRIRDNIYTSVIDAKIRVGR